MKPKDTQPNPCKDHINLIDSLLNQNNELRQKYQNLYKQHQKLKYKYNRLAQISSESVVSQIEGITGIKQIDDIMKIENSGELAARASRMGNTFNQSISDGHVVGSNKLSKTNSTDSNNQIKIVKQQSIQMPNPNTKKGVSFRSSLSSSRSSSLNQRLFPLIQGCFIIQKKKSFSQKSKNILQDMIEFIYPEQLIKTERQTLEMMLKYTFTQPEIYRVVDDSFCSRKNQIIFGTPYDDYNYAFEDGKWVGKKELPDIMRLMGTMKKKYYHILVKPEILTKEEFQGNENSTNQNKQKQEKKQAINQEEGQTFYQTQVIFGFVSSFPLRFFFQDLLRTIQQQLKYSQLVLNQGHQESEQKPLSRKQRYKQLGKIMQKIYHHEYKINKFPIKCLYETGIASIELSIITPQSYRRAEDQFLNNALEKYSIVKISKLLHYVLAEKCIMMEAGDKKSLNQLFEIIRIMIRPFLWIFAVVYVYSDYFQPFMSSPMPIIIGKVSEEEPQIEQKDKKNKQQLKRQSSLDYSQFCYIKMDDQEAQLKQSDMFYKAIKRFKKQWEKNQKQKKQSIASFIHSYVNSLKVFIQKGVLNSEPTDFHIQFIDTQMVSYFKQNNGGSID